MDRIILILIPLPLLAFWAWMFSEMTKMDRLPDCFVTFTDGRDSRFDWTVAFVFLNVYTAAYYYSNVYRNGY
jgi:hypothetical protein